MKETDRGPRDWEAVIDLEVHAELTTLKTKMFYFAPSNSVPIPTRTPVPCLGMPGALPVPNKAAIESIVLAGLATNCIIEKHTMFYRRATSIRTWQRTSRRRKVRSRLHAWSS